MLAFTSCKKGDPTIADPSLTTGTAKPITIIKLTGTVMPGGSKKLTISVSNIGGLSVAKDCTVSTIASGLDMDASGILPASMIGSSGFIFTGDSVVYNGITITNKTGMVTHGDLLNGTRLYGNLAYATLTFGDGFSPQITTKRIPFFLYYKAVEPSGNTVAAHNADLFGIGHGYSTGNKLIASPLAYLPVSGGQISGFKLSMVNFNANSTQGACLLTVGLIPSDLEPANGFNLHPLSALISGGYANYITGTIVCNGASIIGPMAFSTAYLQNSIIQDPKAIGPGYNALASNSSVHIVTNNGFNYIYTVSNTTNITGFEAPTNSGENRSIFGIDFFTQNEFLVDYTNHQIGLKNN
ncbi:hypothetical protein ACFGVR_09160 [Mucilaginibacter sp. AW1-3]